MEAYIDNRKAYFNFEMLDRFEAGIELFGFEVKSVRAGRGSLAGSHIIMRGRECYLVGARIDPYQVGNTPPGYDPMRTRRLLITRKEINELEEVEKKKGLTIVPLSLYSKNGKVKVGFAVAKGKKEFDKRDTIKKRDTDREIRRELKR